MGGLARDAAGLLLAVLVVGSLHFVRPDPSLHAYALPVAGGIEYAFNADSPALARLVVRFPQGFFETEQGVTRSLRPLYPALGWLVFRALGPSKNLVPEHWAQAAGRQMAAANHPAIWAQIDPRDVVLAWGALVLVNVLLYWLAMLMIHDALLPLFGSRAAFLLALVPLVHFDTIGYVFVPGIEPFNVLVPALFLHCLFRTWPTGGSGQATSLVMGMAMLAKPLAFPLVNWLYQSVRVGGGRSGMRTAGWALLAFTGPLAIYLLSLWLSGRPIHHHEVEAYRQVVWMADDVRRGALAAIPQRWLDEMAWHVLGVIRGFSGVLIVLLLLGLQPTGNREVPGVPWRHLALYGTGCAAFWCLVGGGPVLQLRWAVTQYPVLILALATAEQGRSRKPEVWLAAAIALGIVAYTLGLHQLTG